MRTRYQFGTVEKRERRRGPAVWVYRYYDATGKRKSVSIGTVDQYRTEAEATKASEGLRLVANPDKPTGQLVTFGAVIQQFKREELPERKSTRSNYLPWINNYIEPKWSEYSLNDIARVPINVELWLKGLDLAPKSKGHVKSLMKLIFASAMRWGLVDLQKNPIELVRVKGVTKRQTEPRILQADELLRLMAHLKEPYRTMVMVAVCTGLRVSEIIGLQWGDFDWPRNSMMIQRAVVLGVSGEVKTRHSKKRIPMDPQLATILKAHEVNYRFCDWVFANPDTDKPWWPHRIQQRWIARAAVDAEISGFVGWHTFRHTYSSMLRQLGVDVKVQQELLRHADIRTTLDGYTQVLVADSLREANSKVVRLVLQ